MYKVRIKEIPFGLVGIYKLNFPNNKCYIGQSIDIRARVREHNERALNTTSYRGRDIQICEYAIRKYGKITQFDILELCSVETLDRQEKYWISYYDSTNRQKGYNLLDHGGVSGRRGYDNANAAFTYEQSIEVIEFILNNPSMSLKQISEHFGVCSNVITRINNGYSYKSDNYTYPLRSYFERPSTRKNELKDYFISEEQFNNLIYDLKYSWWLSMEKDIPKKYGLPRNIIKDINYGRKFSKPTLTYPIRIRNSTALNKLSKEQVLEILELLKNTDKPMSTIGKKYNIGRGLVGRINKGESYTIDGYEYPARETFTRKPVSTIP